MLPLRRDGRRARAGALIAAREERVEDENGRRRQPRLGPGPVARDLEADVVDGVRPHGRPQHPADLVGLRAIEGALGQIESAFESLIPPRLFVPREGHVDAMVVHRPDVRAELERVDARRHGHRGRERLQRAARRVEHRGVDDGVFVLLPLSGVGHEVEAALHHGPLQPAVVVARAHRRLRGRDRVARVQGAVAALEADLAVIGVRAWLRHDLDAIEARLRELRRERVRVDPDHLDRVFGRQALVFTEPVDEQRHVFRPSGRTGQFEQAHQHALRIVGSRAMSRAVSTTADRLLRGSADSPSGSFALTLVDTAIATRRRASMLFDESARRSTFAVNS